MGLLRYNIFCGEWFLRDLLIRCSPGVDLWFYLDPGIKYLKRFFDYLVLLTPHQNSPESKDTRVFRRVR